VPTAAGLQAAFVASSPRGRPGGTPWRSALIHGFILVFWALLLVAALRLGQGFAWGTGMAYIAYDTLLLLFVAWHTRKLVMGTQSPALGSAPATAGGAGSAAQLRPRVGVIVAAHNEALVLPVTLRALLEQTDPPDLILIADDGSTDATAALLLREHGLQAPAPGTLSAPSPVQPSLRWLRLPHGGKARALNAAVLLADTDVLLTVDGDTLLERHAIAEVRRAFAAEPALAVVTGVITPVCGRSWSGRFFQWFQTYEYIRNFLSRYAWMQVDSLLLVSGAFAGFRRDALLAVGGFDPDCLVEDYELIHRLRQHAVAHGLDWRVRVLGGAQARTEAPSTLPAFLRQRRRWFGGFLQTQYWYRAMVGDRRYGWLGTLMLPVKAVDTLQPLYGLTAFALLVFYLLAGRLGVLLPVAVFIGGKITIDLAFHLWSVHLYRRWVGDTTRASLWEALLAALAEPFTFQLMRHTGAAWGWVSFLTGRGGWGVQQRVGMAADSPARSDPGRP
jgi:cellulose synthase/poly-beta-1,6-N-acetylglucosamine synthase-like glycosyltransferase